MKEIKIQYNNNSIHDATKTTNNNATIKLTNIASYNLLYRDWELDNTLTVNKTGSKLFQIIALW